MMKLLGKEGQAMLIVKYLFSMMLPKVAYAMNLALFDVESSEYVAATIRNAIRLRRENKVRKKGNFRVTFQANSGKFRHF